MFSHERGDPHATLFKSVDIDNQLLTNSPEITPIRSEITTYLYDLHKVHSQSPLLDSETIPFIPIQWSGPPNQVPLTFPIRPAEKRPFYCFDFIKFGKCDKKDVSDTFHVSLTCYVYLFFDLFSKSFIC